VDAVKGGKIRIIAQSILDHSATYRGLVIARKDSGLRRVEDLEGKRFAFVDPKSASGYVYPRAMLLEKGVTPARFFKETTFAVENLVTLASTDPIPHDAIAVQVGLDEALARQIQTALVNVDKTEAGKRALANSKKKLTGHVIADDSLFDVVRRTAKLAGM